jgi:hypothetical protein
MAKKLGATISFRSMGPLSFFCKKRWDGMPNGLAAVMTLLHFLPRWQKEPAISLDYRRLTGKNPTRLAAFLHREQR